MLRKPQRSIKSFLTRSLPPLRLYPTLVSVITTLLSGTVIGIGTIAFLKTSESFEILAHQQLITVAQVAKEHVGELVSESPQILIEYQMMAQQGILPIDDTNTISEIFAERLRQQPDMAWIGYGSDITGIYTGATRRYGEDVRLYTANPAINHGVPVEEEQSADRSRRKVRGRENQPYRVKEKDWFRRSLSAGKLTWLNVYTFTDGRRGITAVIPLRHRKDAKPYGVLHTDVFIDTLENRLNALRVGRTGRIHILDRSGRSIASPKAWRTHDPILKAALSSIGGREALAKLRQGVNSGVLVSHSHDWRAAFERVDIPNGPDWIVAVVAPEREFTGLALDNALLTLVTAAVGLSLAVWAAQLISHRIAEPLKDISEDLERIALFDFSGDVTKPSFIREVEILKKNTSKMKASLRSFGRYVPTDLVRDLLVSGREAILEGSRQKLTIHISDIAGFTSISEQMNAELLVDELGDYFALMTEVLQGHGGTLDKMMGDGIMAFFNAPHPLDQHETKACLAALEAQGRLTADREHRRLAGRPEFSARIGLASGEVIVGNIGTPDRFAYTAIGDVVNLASRLEGLCKFYGVSILTCPQVHATAGEAFEWRALDRVAVVGRRSGTQIFQLLGMKGELSSEEMNNRDKYEASLSHYFAGRFEQARQGFDAICKSSPSDLAAAVMAARSEQFCKQPPKPDWDGIFVHVSK